MVWKKITVGKGDFILSLTGRSYVLEPNDDKARLITDDPSDGGFHPAHWPMHSLNAVPMPELDRHFRYESGDDNDIVPPPNAKRVGHDYIIP